MVKVTGYYVCIIYCVMIKDFIRHCASGCCLQRLYERLCVCCVCAVSRPDIFATQISLTIFMLCWHVVWERPARPPATGHTYYMYCIYNAHSQSTGKRLKVVFTISTHSSWASGNSRITGKLPLWILAENIWLRQEKWNTPARLYKQ